MRNGRMQSRCYNDRPILGAVTRLFGVVAVTLSLGVLAGCAESAVAKSPLSNVYETPEELVEAVLEQLKAGADQETMESFLISRSEYEEILWPEMPDEEYTPFNFFWGMVRKGQIRGVRQFMQQYGGLDLELVEIRMPTLESDLESYENFTFHKRVEVIVRDRATGEVGELPSFDVFLEHRGVWKLTNYDEL
jgi:hypothetical protein